MSIFEKKITVTITCGDRTYLSSSKLILKEIRETMEEENADCLENSYTGEIIERADIANAIQIIDSLLDSQQEWKWELI